MTLIMEKFSALRGIGSKTTKTANSSVGATAQSSQINSSAELMSTATVQPQKQQEKLQASYSEPIEIPCKNYSDEQGHFAYIDANTGQIAHVNLETGNVYKMTDVYRLSLQHAVSPLSPDYHRLTWQKMLSDETVYDRFGSPIFSFAEIQSGYEKYVMPNCAAKTENKENQPKTDAF